MLNLIIMEHNSKIENIYVIEIFTQLYLIAKTNSDYKWMNILDEFWNKIKQSPLDKVNNYWDLLGDVIDANLCEDWQENYIERNVLFTYIQYDYSNSQSIQNDS